MDTTIGAFDTQDDARIAINALIRAGFDPVSEMEMISHATIAADYAQLEQHPETEAVGSVASLGAPTPPPSADPTLSAGPLGQAYLQAGVEGLSGALLRAGLDERTAHFYADCVDQGGVLVAIYGEDRQPQVLDILRKAQAQILG